MSKKEDLIRDIKSIFSKYDVYLSTNDIYNGIDEYCGQDIEIKSKTFTNNRLEILFDITELAE